MMRLRTAGFLFCLLCLAVGALGLRASVGRQTPTATGGGSASASFLELLDVDLREPVGRCLPLTPATEKSYADIPTPLRRRLLIRAVMRCEDQTPFVIDRLRAEPAETRLWLLREMPLYVHWRRHPAVNPALEALVDTDISPEVVRQALETHRQLDVQRLRDRLDARLAQAMPAREDMAKMLIDEQERWVSLERGATLPGFLRQLGKPFAVKAPAQAVRVVAFGDFGTGQADQRQTAMAIRTAHTKRRFDLGLTLGDNFYTQGLADPRDPRWTREWEQLYGPLRIPFYATLGNHDWYQPDSPAAEILHSRDSASWRMPASYYTFTAGPAQFFALDTDAWSERQADWLRAQLAASAARWKIVYGHHPPFVAPPAVMNPAYHEELARWAARLVPILAAGHADLMLAGHHHSLQHLAPHEGVEFFIAGGGGAVTYPVGATGPEASFAEAAHGYAVLEIGQDSLTVRLVSTDRGQRYAYVLHHSARSATIGSMRDARRAGR